MPVTNRAQLEPRQPTPPGNLGSNRSMGSAELAGSLNPKACQRVVRRGPGLPLRHQSSVREKVLTRLCRENATVAPPEILRCTQKLLDRVLFCAFCEDRGLLPAKSLKSAFEHHDPYNPKPVWLNFRGLFRAIDEGNAGLNIPAYNGGLFAPDPALDALQVPDEVCAYFKDLGDYDYRPAREVAEGDESTEVRSVIDVDILGHIFEQSITDLERLRLSLERGEGAPTFLSASGATPRSADKNVGAPQFDETQARKRRKQEGAVYTRGYFLKPLRG